ncbi:unnamed protein product [Prorocentrum cordatum]|uniref:Uncharacterized protein n=1 Tax=Prorocentrum cordatum TaxID=2364126 RepID=A0ABN9TLC6_9DINO|nr:unnamed protein product [Polarella glacialis]
MPAMPAQLKALRAQRRREGRADFNAALTATVRHVKYTKSQATKNDKKVDAAFKKLERAMKQAGAAEEVFRMVLREAEVWRNVRIRATDRLVAVGGLARARGRKALGVA